jgi:hypothetical protein
MLTHAQNLVDKNDIIYLLIPTGYVEDLCQICNKNEIEIYQLDIEVCFDCWMKQTSPEI